MRKQILNNFSFKNKDNVINYSSLDFGTDKDFTIAITFWESITNENS